MMRLFRKNRKPGNRNAGFTIVELLVAAVLSAVLVAIIYTLYVSYSEVVIHQEERVEMQQIARMALQSLKNELMLIGRNVATENGQESVIYAAPYEMLYNADHHYLQYDDGSTERDYYRALGTGNCIDYGFAALDDYCGNDSWDSPAEAIHLFMADPAVGEDFSFAPYDREIHLEINNNNVSEKLAYGIRYNDGTMSYAGSVHPPVLFSFWGDFDLNPSTPDTLWGDSSDASSIGRLTSDEIETLLNGSYEWKYNSAVGEITVSDITDGAIFLNVDGGGDFTNSEDISNFGVLDPGEDLNGNGRLDTNLLDFAIHRIELNVIGISQYLDQKYSHPNDAAYHYREHHVKTSVDPRNLRQTPVIRTCGDSPPAPTNVTATAAECDREIQLSWTRSSDDGIGENDIMWYEIQRMVPPEASGTGSWTYYSFVPAHGQTTYTFTDTALDINQVGEIISKEYKYQVSAVDCASQQSPWAASSGVTPSQNFPVEPYEVLAHTLPCFKDTTSINSGGIAVTWRQSPTPGVDEYWLYRSPVNETGSVYAEPFAKPNISDLNTTCATSPTTERDAFYDCRNSNFFQYSTSSGEIWLVWKDVVNSPGRDGVSMVPEDGHQFGINNGDVEDSIARYAYEVRAFNSSAANRCLSKPTLQTPTCSDDYCDSQGYVATGGSGFDSNSRSRYAPPRDFYIQDATVVNANGVMHPRFILSWNESLSESCEFGSGDADIPDIDRYLIYRHNQPLAEPFQQSNLLDLNRACSLKFEDPDFYDYTTGQGVFAFYGIDATATSGPEVPYVFVDDADFYVGGLTPAATHVAYQLVADDTLEPAATQFIPRELQTGYECLWTGDGVCDPGEMEDYVYEYIVAAANPDRTSDPWSFGASCVKRARFECLDSCGASIDLTVGNEPYLNQCSLRGGSDQVDIYFKFVGTPPAEAEIRLVARADDDDSNPWLLVDTSIEPSSGYMHATHEYQDGQNGAGTIGQRPPVLWEYAVELICGDCTRYVSTGLHLPAGLPDLNDLCFNPNMSGCDSTNKARFDCSTGLFRFHFDDVLNRCNSGSGPITTQEQFMWYRIARWSKAPSYYGDDGSWPWCENSYQGFPFPVDPSEYSEGRCSLPDTPAEKIYYVRADGDHCSYVPEPNPTPGPVYECLNHVDTDSTATGFFKRENSSGGYLNHKYGFQEYVNPNLDYWYQIELRIDHDPVTSGGMNTPVRCCPGMSPGAEPPIPGAQVGDDCPGGYEGDDTCNGVVFPYSVISYEHIQCYPAWDDYTPPDPNPYPYGPGTVDFDRFYREYTPGTAWEEPIEYTDSAYNTPWMSYNIKITFPEGPTNPFTGDPLWNEFEVMNEHMFYYKGDGLSSGPPNDYMTGNIRSDIDWGLGGSVWAWIIENIGSTIDLFCDFINIFTSWPECYTAAVDFANHSYIWSNFTPPTASGPGQCGSDSATAKLNNMDGDMLWHFSIKANSFDRSALALFRGKFDPAVNGFNYYWLKFDHDRSNQYQTCLSLGYTYKDNATVPAYVQTCRSFPDKEREDDWWTTLVLVCDNHESGSAYEDHTFIYVWSQTDGDYTNPSGGSESYGWDWQRGPYEWGDGSSGNEFFYHHTPILAFNTTDPNAWAPIPAGLPQERLADVDNQRGKIGFWVDPWDMRLPTPEWRYDNIRVTRYCGKCPPDQLWSATKFNTKGMPEGWQVGVKPFYEAMVQDE